MMQPKDLIALLAVAVSLASAWFANEARERAEAVAADRFRSEKTLEILALIHREFAAAKDDPRKMTQSCVFAGSLGRAELELRDGDAGLVAPFLIGLSRSGAVPPGCDLQWEDLFAASLVRAQALPQAQVAPMASPDGYGGSGDAASAAEIGAWHAVIASYAATPDGCRYALEDVEDFSRRLREAGVERRLVAIYRTSISDHYAVTIDAGESRAEAERLAAAARRAARGDGTGADAFAQGNRGWYVDAPACEKAAWTQPET